MPTKMQLSVGKAVADGPSRVISVHRGKTSACRIAVLLLVMGAALFAHGRDARPETGDCRERSVISDRVCSRRFDTPRHGALLNGSDYMGLPFR